MRDSSFKSGIKKIFDDMVNLTINHSNSSIFNTSEFNKCISNITEESFFKMFYDHYYSGRLVVDPGDESDCYQNDYSYFLLRFQINDTYLSNHRNTSVLNFLDTDIKKDFLKFIQKSHTYIGFCFFNGCNETIYQILDDEINPNLKNELLLYTGLNITTNHLNVSKFLNGKYPNRDFIIFFSIIGVYLLIKIGMIIYSIIDKRIRKELTFRPERESMLDNKKKSKKKDLKKNNELFKYFSIKYQMEILSNDLEIYFNDSKLIYFHLIRIIIMNMINFYTCFSIFFAVPKMNEDSFKLLKGGSFNIIKLTYYVSSCIYFINGVFFSYKIIGFIFKYKSYRIKNLLYFYLHFIIRMIPTFLIIYAIYSFGNEFIYFFSSRPVLSKTTFSELYDSEISRKVYDEDFMSIIELILKYFYINMFDYKYENRIQPYMQLIFFVLNDFYIFTFSIVLFYILFKCRNKYLELAYFFGVFGILIKIYFNNDSSNFSIISTNNNGTAYLDKSLNFTIDSANENFGFNFFQIIYNLNSIVRIEHSYICYFLGNLIGILFFFHITNDPLFDYIKENHFKNYYPFEFILKISYFINNKLKKKKTIMIIIFILMIISSFILTFNYNSKLHSSVKLILDYNLLSNILVRYEIILFNIIFAIFIYASFFIFTLTEIHGKKFILMISRSYYVFIPLCFILNYYIFVFFQIDMDVYFSNILFFNFSSFLIIYITALLILLLFEIPLRMLFKRKIKKLFGFSEERNF